MHPPKMVAADVPDRGRMWYLVDDQLDFIPEVKAFLDWKAARKRAPATLAAYCYRLSWYYRFLAQRGKQAIKAQPNDLTEFVIWLCNPYRETSNVMVIHEPSPIQASTVNQILVAVHGLYLFLVRRGELAASPVIFEEVPKSQWLVERDLLAHTRRGQQARTVKRMALRLKEPFCLPKTISEKDFQSFVNSIALRPQPNGDPSGFRDRLICNMLYEGGFRIGELLGMRVEDIDVPQKGVHVRFRPDNENGARAKAGYGRDRFVDLPPEIMGLLDIYLTEVWIEAHPHTDHLWIVLKREARDHEGQSTYGTALSIATVEQMFQHYSQKSAIRLHPHMLRHTHATELARSYLMKEQAVDWKFIQERLGHASVVTTMQVYAHLTKEDTKRAYELYRKRSEQSHAERKTRGIPTRS